MPYDWKPWGDSPEGFGPTTLELIRLWSETTLSLQEIADKLGRTRKSCERKVAEVRKRYKKDGLTIQRPQLEIPKQQVIGDTVSPPADSNKATRERESENVETIESYGNQRIHTLEDLLDFFEVDQTVWKVDHWIANKWEVGAKLGREGPLVTHPLYQVKAWLVRIQPLQIEPVVSPVSITFVTPPRVALVDQSGMFRGFVWPDPQFGFQKSLRTAKLTPFHDRAALDIALQIAQNHPEAEYAAWLGDFMDLADWSDKFTRDPNFYWTTQPAAIEGKWWMSQFRSALPKARMKLIEGNHEARLRKQLTEHLKEAFGLRSVDALDLPPLMSIPRILALHELDIEWIEDYPNGQSWVNDFVVCEHGAIARSGSGATVSSMVSDADETKIIGHIHRIECAMRTIHGRLGQRTAAVWSAGCLCRVDGIVPGVKDRENWQQGFAVLDYFLDGRPNHSVNVVQINNGEAFFEGKHYVARDRVEEMRESISGKYDDGVGWNF